MKKQFLISHGHEVDKFHASIYSLTKSAEDYGDILEIARANYLNT